jgi:hypothetical protein
MKLPNTAKTIETLSAKVEAVDMVDGLINRNFELEEIHAVLAPLLYALSMKLYTDETPVTLSKLVQDSIEWINRGEIQ